MPSISRILPKTLHTTATARPFSGFGTAAENQINEWLRKRGDDGLANKGKRLEGDRHRHTANSFGIGNDNVQSKILADNNIQPESIQRRILLAEGWEKPRLETRTSFQKSGNTVDDFVANQTQQFAQAIQELDLQSKKVNEVMISDSLRFNGRSPVPRARRFQLKERIREAIEGGQ